MVFSSFLFLCFFLPVVLILHSFIKNSTFRNALLIIASVVFYACGEPVYVLLLLASAAMNYGFGRWIGNKKKKGILALSVIINLGLLAVFKYAGWLTEALNSALAGIGLAVLPVPHIALPIGISFYTFQALSYVVDVYRGDVKAQKSFFSLLLYISFFPQLIAGPIVKYHDIESQLQERSVSWEDVKEGLIRFTVGLSKKVLIANVMAEAADKLFALGNGQVDALSAWIAAAAYMLQIYFDFSGYSDMAIGLGRLFGFAFRENFNYPYTADSIQEFWRRWHISLSTWFKEYLYIPLGGNRKGKGRTYLNRFIVFAATGLWHGANWTFLLWGLFHGLFLVLESSGLLPVKKIRWKPVRIIYTLLVVLLGFVLFRADSISQAWTFVKAMFGAGAPMLASPAVLSFLDPYHGVLFLVAVIGCTELPKRCWRKLLSRMKPGSASGAATVPSSGSASMSEAAPMILSLIGLLLCFLSLASGSYNPFIYFRF